MLISIIVPVYKVEPYLHQCVNSVLSQSYTEFELILVDDGSPDNCPSICDDFAKKDARVKVIHKENGGLSDARNVGLRHSIGQYVIFLDSDDLWASSDGIKNLIKILAEHQDADIVFFQKFSFIDGETPILPVEYSHLDCNLNGKSKIILLSHLQSRGNLLTSAYTKLVKRSLLINNNIFFEKGLLSEDFDWSLNLYCNCKSILFSDEIFYAYRKRSGSITKSVGIKHLNDLLWIIKKWSTLLDELKIEKKERDIYKDFLCYVYMISLSYVDITKNEYREMLKKLELYRGLFEFANNKKTMLAAKIYKICGFLLTCCILRLFNLLKK